MDGDYLLCIFCVCVCVCGRLFSRPFVVDRWRPIDVKGENETIFFSFLYFSFFFETFCTFGRNRNKSSGSTPDAFDNVGVGVYCRIIRAPFCP